MKTLTCGRSKPASAAKVASSLNKLSEAMARFPVGTLVGLAQDMEETGVVTGYNFSSEGYYPAGRYPLVVLFGDGEVECSLDMVVSL